MIKDGNDYTQSYLLYKIHGHGTLPSYSLTSEYKFPDGVFMATA